MPILRLIFVSSIFSSAFLLFLVQPLLTRMLLPLYGGGPAVWNTALVFFQVLLLGGYLYAFLLSRLRSALAILAIHAGVLLLPLLLLPPALPTNAALGTPTGLGPAASLLAALGVIIAAPFFSLSSNSSLIQWWWSLTPAQDRHDPYWLYGASNLGSLVALLAYPFVVEPLLGLEPQTLAWSAGYAVFALLTLTAMLTVVPRHAGLRPSPSSHDIDHRASARKSTAETEASTDVTRPAPRRVQLWVIRSAVASSLLLSVTTQITTDLAPTPLLWVVPLALYLVTFILAFGVTDRLARPPLMAATTICLAASVGLLIGGGRPPFGITLATSLATLFVGALLCHRDLAANRPPPRYLTAFYLWISFGGALGGVLNSILAPLVFNSVAEHPLTLIALAGLLYVSADGLQTISYRPGWGVALLAGAALSLPLVGSLGGTANGAALGLILAGAGLWALASKRYVGLVGITVALSGGLTLAGLGQGGDVVARDRSFFGVVSVRDDGQIREMLHGTTIHGFQWKDPARRRVAASYYHPSGPLGSFIPQAPAGARIGVVGLGTGGLAATASVGHQLTFFEIDPLVERMAREYFTYLSDSPATVQVVLGDGRLTVAAEPDGSFDVLIIDAFSSDFVPIHLLTSQALTLYLDKVKEGGVLALHISNRHADLRRVVLGYAQATDRLVLFSDYSPSGQAAAEGASRTLAAALAPVDNTLLELAAGPLWTASTDDVRPVRWTDDHANLLSVLR